MRGNIYFRCLFFALVLIFSVQQLSAQRIYWTQGTTVRSANLDGTDVQVEYTNAETPFALSIDNTNNFAFVLTQPGQGKAYKLSLPGFTSPVVIYDWPSMTAAYNIAHHDGDQQVYYNGFVDSDDARIERSNYTDQDCCQTPQNLDLGGLAEFGNFHDIAIDTDDERVYVSYDGNGRIYYVPTGGFSNNIVVISGAGEAFDLDLVNTNIVYELPGSNQIARANKNNGSGASVIISGLSDIKAINVHKQDGRIFILDGTTIKWAESDGSGLTQILSGLTGATDIAIAQCGDPSTQVTGFVASSIDPSSIQLNWTNGSGDETIIVAKEAAAVDVTPRDGITHTPSSVFGAGEDLGGSNFVVYKGTGTSTTITGLNPLTTYHFAAYTLNSYGQCYRTFSPATASETTVCNYPSTQASAIVLTPTNNTMDLTWVRGNGSQVIVLARQGATVTSDPLDFTNYTANSAFGSGDLIGADNYVVYKGTGSSVTVTNLTMFTEYAFAVYEFNSLGPCYLIPPASNAMTTTQSIPLIADITIPNAAMKIGDLVTATITVSDDQGDNYALVSGDIEGMILSNLAKVNNTTYTAEFTIPDGGTDFAASDNLGVNNLVLENSIGTDGTPFNGAISQNGDPIDANRPTVISLVRLDPNPTNASNLSFQVTFSEGVSGFDIADLSTFTTGTVTASISSVSPIDATNYSIAISSVTGDGAITLEILNTASINDLAGNGYNSNFTSGESYTVDNTPPGFISATLTNPTSDGFDFSINLDEIGNVYYVVTTNAATPSPAQVQAGLDAGSVSVTSGTFVSTTSGIQTITGESPNTLYYVHYLSEDGLGNQSSVLTDNITTICDPPTVDASTIIFNNITETTVDISWTNGNGDSRLMLMKEGGPPDFVPVNGVDYAGLDDKNYTLATDLGGGNKLVFLGSGNSVTVSNLTGGSGYHVIVFEINSGQLCYTATGPEDGFFTCTVPGSPTNPVDGEYCEGDGVPTLQVDDFVSGVDWYDAPTGGTKLASGATFTPSDLGSPGTVTFYTEYLEGTCVSASRTAVNLTKYGLITNNTASGAQTICSGDTPSGLSGTLPIGGDDSFVYLWESSTGSDTGPFTTAAGTNNQQNYSPASVPVTTWFRRVVTSATCSDISNVIEVTAIPPVTAGTIGADHSVCFGGDPDPLSESSLPTGGDGTFNYQWQLSTVSDTGPFTDITGATNAGYDPPAGLSATTYYRRNDSSSGCAEDNTNVVTVTVLPEPVINTHPVDMTACENETASFSVSATGSGGLTYQWQKDDGTGFVNVTNSGSVTGATTATLSINDLTGLDGTEFKVLVSEATCTVESNPAVLDLVPASNAIIVGTKTICNGESSTISVSISGGQAPYTIEIDNGIGVIANYSSNQSISVTPNATVTYRLVSVTDAAGCPGNISGTARITVTNPPTNAQIGGGGSVCRGTASNINVNITGGVSPYTVEISGGVGVVNSYVSGSNISVNPGNSITYSLISVVDANGCPSQALSGSAIVNIDEPPTTATAGNDVNICDNTFSNLGGNTPSVGTGQWTVISGSGIVTNPSSPTSGVTNLSNGDNVFQWTIRNGQCTPSSDRIIITKEIPPAGTGFITTANGQTEFCPEDIGITFQVTGIVNATTYEWTMPSGFEAPTFVTDVPNITVDLNDPIAGTVSVKGINQCGEVASQAINVTIKPVPTLSINALDEVKQLREVTFSFSSSSDISDDVSWSFGDGNTSQDASPVHIYTDPGTYTVTVVFVDQIGCTGSASIDIRVLELSAVSIKNAVTPNNDGANDILFIEGIEDHPDNIVILLDRWGVEIDRINQYDNRSNFWPQLGQEIPAGNYMCIVELPEAGKVLKRTITVVKE